MTIYLIIGTLIALFIVYNYRRDGKSMKKGDMYIAIATIWLWPVMVLLFILYQLTKGFTGKG